MATSLVAINAFPQWNFVLDTTFRTEISQRYVNSLIPLEDGSVIASGVMRLPSYISDQRLIHLLPNGVQDPDVEISGLGGGKLVNWENGKFYVQISTLVRRSLSTCISDPTYITMNSGPYFQSSNGGDYHVFPDGRVLLSGSHTLSDSIRGFVGSYELVWFTDQGYLDTTRIHRNANGTIWDFKELPDGKFLCSCGCTQYEGQPVNRVFRVHPNGDLDTTFTSDITAGNIYEYEALSDGSVFIGGNYRRPIVSTDTLHLARFLPNGEFDAEFGPLQFGGNMDWWLWSGTLVLDIFPFLNGTYIIAGQFTSVNGSPRSGLCMIDSAGVLLDAFSDFYLGPYTIQSSTGAGVTNVYWNHDSTALYICGTYEGVDDGTYFDPEQRFISRLLVEQIPLNTSESVIVPKPQFSLHPNPAKGWVAFNYTRVDAGVEQGRIVIRDVTGRLLTTLLMNGKTDQLFWDCSKIASGTYLVQFLVGEDLIHTEKLVIQE